MLSEAYSHVFIGIEVTLYSDWKPFQLFGHISIFYTMAITIETFFFENISPGGDLYGMFSGVLYHHGDQIS